jgi:hypothetical protein
MIFFCLIYLASSQNLTISNSRDYTGKGSFAETSLAGTDAYLSSIRKDYKFRLVNEGSIDQAIDGSSVYWPVFYQIDIRVQPCYNYTLTGGRGDTCCDNTGEVNCQDFPSQVHAGPDMQVAFISNAHISTCLGTEFADDINCGTFIELHRTGSELTESVAEILADIRLKSNGGAFSTEWISTQKLCAGVYELWWVVRTRSGPYVQFRKSFTVITPSC